MKCIKCGDNQRKKRCVNKCCKKCCSNPKCQIHNQTLCPKCEQNNMSPSCSKFYCESCCDIKNCSNSVHREKFLKCECGKKRFDSKCVDLKCFDCCSNKTCSKHKDKFNKCIGCKIHLFNCELEYCDDCCDNKSCSKHFIKCSCNSSNYINLKCEYKKCKECCVNIKCLTHFIQDYDLSCQILNNYKVELYKMKNIPAEIINIIIDDYVDARYKCTICGYKINFDVDFSNGCIVNCDGCDEWVCDHLYGNCSKSVYDGCKIYNYCIECYDELDELDELDEIESDLDLDLEV